MTRVKTASAAAAASIGLALVSALAAAIFGLLYISRPIAAMTAAMTRLARGEAGTEIPFRHRRDEIGAMAAAVQVFKDNLIRTRQLEAEAAQQDAEHQRGLAMRQVAGQVLAEAARLSEQSEHLNGQVAQFLDRVRAV